MLSQKQGVKKETGYTCEDLGEQIRVIDREGSYSPACMPGCQTKDTCESTTYIMYNFE